MTVNTVMYIYYNVMFMVYDTVAHLQPRHPWDMTKCLDLYHAPGAMKHTLGHLKVSLIQGCPHFRGVGLEGYHCMYILLQYVRIQI